MAFEINDIVTLKPWNDFHDAILDAHMKYQVYMPAWVKEYCGRDAVIYETKKIYGHQYYKLLFEDGVVPAYWFAENSLYIAEQSTKSTPISFAQLLKGE